MSKKGLKASAPEGNRFPDFRLPHFTSGSKNRVQLDLFAGKGSFKPVGPSRLFANDSRKGSIEVREEVLVPKVSDAWNKFVHDTLESLHVNFEKIDNAYREIGEQVPDQPPKTGEYIICCFLPLADQDAVVGDLAEHYPKRIERFGVRAAQFWYYKQVISSIWPLLRTALIKWGLFGSVVEFIRRMSS